MSVTGNINEVLQQIQFLIKIYGDVTFKDLERSVAMIRNK